MCIDIIIRTRHDARRRDGTIASQGERCTRAARAMNIHIFFIALPLFVSEAHVQIDGELSLALELPYKNANTEMYFELKTKCRDEFN